MIENTISFGIPITLESKSVLAPYFDANPNRISALGFSSLYMWEGHKYIEIDGYLCVFGRAWFGPTIQEPFMFTPLPLDGKYDVHKLRDVILHIKNNIQKEGSSVSILGVPEVNVALFDEALIGIAVGEEDKDNWDYIYKRSDLESLASRKYAKKRNHLNHFRSKWKYTYEEITPECIPELMEVVDEFVLRKAEKDDTDSLVQLEGQLIKRILPEYQQIGFFGGLIRIDGKIEAFTMASKHTKDTVDVGIEKANSLYRGLYQAINIEFAKSLPPEIVYINREEDMGLASLRQTKRSYYPCCMFKVYSYRL